MGQEVPFGPAGEIGPSGRTTIWRPRPRATAPGPIKTGVRCTASISSEGLGGHCTGKAVSGVAARFDGSGSQSDSLYSGMAGPRFGIEWRKSHLLWFGEYLGGDAQARVAGESQTTSSFSRNSFVWGSGTGLQLVLARRYTVTLLHLDALNLEAPDVVTGHSHWRGDLRYSAGVGYRFERKQP